MIRVPNIAFLPAQVDACALYRMYIPHLNLTNARFIFDPTKVPIELLQYQKTEVVVVQRLSSEGNKRSIELLKANRFKVVYDLDDNLWAIPHYNPAKKMLQDHQMGFVHCAMAADLITVSTRPLQSAVAQAIPAMADRIRVCPNGIEFRWFKNNLVRRDDDKVVIGWAGSNTHDEDVKVIFNVILKLLRTYPQLHFEYAGGGGYTYGRSGTIAIPKDPLPKDLASHPRVSQRRWVPVAEYPASVSSWGWDISLAPLEDNRFNRSKSNIKFLEAAACGMVCVGSDVGPYTEFCKHDLALSWLLCRTPGDWERKLSLLIEDADARHAYHAHMHKVALEHYDIQKLIGTWQSAARDACTF